MAYSWFPSSLTLLLAYEDFLTLLLLKLKNAQISIFDESFELFDIAFSECFVKLIFQLSTCPAFVFPNSGVFIIFVVTWTSILTFIFSLELRVIIVMFCRSTLTHFVLVWLGNPQAIVTIRNPALFLVNKALSTFVQHFDLSNEKKLHYVRNRNIRQSSPSLSCRKSILSGSRRPQQTLPDLSRYLIDNSNSWTLKL